MQFATICVEFGPIGDEFGHYGAIQRHTRQFAMINDEFGSSVMSLEALRGIDGRFSDDLS